MKFQIWIWLAGLLCGHAASAQPDAAGLPPQILPLTDLSAFQPATANWQIAGNAYADRNVPQMMEARPGKGVLVNLSDAKNRAHLFTRLEHGDMELELDVMMAKESNSGIYFQGRYEVQLQDSWGKTQKPKYGDIGGIYQRTDTVTDKGYEGSAPAVNASRAPGLWQHLRIVFQAPRFDANGHKTANARFLKVYVNGSLVQDNFEVTGPTRSAGFKDEKPLGPIMIQGNHGRVAFKDIRYKLYTGRPLHIAGLVLKEYKSPGDSIKSYGRQKPVNETATDSISYLAAKQADINLLEYSGRLIFPEAGNYFFKMQNGGGGLLIIGGDTVVTNNGVHSFDDEATGVYTAAAGAVPFTLVHNKLIGWRKGLALYAEGPGIRLHPLHAPGSVFYEPPVEPIVVQPEPGSSTIQRSFVQDGGRKRTHCISVGTNGAPSFTIDLETGALFQLWDGAFLETTSMWHRRGNQQTAVPLGTVIGVGEELVLSIPKRQVRKGTGARAFRFLEYNLDNHGLPTFSYRIDGQTVLDKITPSVSERSLARKITVQGKTDILLQIASGSTIEQLPDGSFAMHNKSYYLTFDPAGPKPVLQNSDGTQQLVVPIRANGPHVVQYTLLW